MRVLVSGAGGLVGGALVPALLRAGHVVRRLVRSRPRDAGEYRWDPATGTMDPAAVAGADAVVHLAGAGIADGRWTAARREVILESRRAGTRMIAGAILRATPPPRVLVCASAIGFYGDRGQEVLTESSPPGGGFLAEVVRVWEDEARTAAAAGTRVVHLRSGLVLSRRGGALPRMALPFRLGAGGPVGDGRQWVSWITLADLIRVVEHALDRADLRGPVNAVSPGTLPQREFARALGRELGRPCWLPLPAWAVRVLLGEMGRELLLFSQRVMPGALTAGGFAFGAPGIADGLRQVLRSDPSTD